MSVCASQGGKQQQSRGLELGHVALSVTALGSVAASGCAIWGFPTGRPGGPEGACPIAQAQKRQRDGQDDVTGETAMDRSVPLSVKALLKFSLHSYSWFTEQFMTFVFSQALKSNDFP